MMQMAMMKGKGKGKGKSDKGLSDFDPEKKAWLGNLPADITFKELMTHFNQAGKTKWAECWKNNTGGVAFATAEEAANAIATLNGSELKGSIIQVDVWTAKNPKAEREAGEKKRKRTDGGAW